MRPDFKQFRGFGLLALSHSAKGTTWEKHKYIKRKDGTYYYPDDYEGGRHLPDGEKENSDEETLSKDDVLSRLEEMTGMKREGLTDLYNLSREKGYDSAEFKELLGILSEGDEDQAKRMTDLLKQGRSKIDLSANDIENLAKEVIRGNFGNGQERKDLLGENYQEIQNRVNELMKGSSGSTKVSDIKEEDLKEAEKVVEEAVQTVTKAGLDFETIYGVYRRRG